MFSCRTRRNGGTAAGSGSSSDGRVIDMPARLARWGWLATVAALATATSATGCSSGDDDAEEPEPPERTTNPPTPPQPPTSVTTTTAPPAAIEGTWWRPTKGLSWQWQLDGEAIDLSVDAEVFDVDLWATPIATIQTLHDQDRKVICYLSAGSWEPYRPDADDFPAAVLGGVVEGWPDERWLDIRQIDVLEPLMAARFDLCRDKGYDGVEPDWMDNFQQDTGFRISADDQLAYNRMLAGLAHERGLAIGLKNDLNQVAELADLFDYAVNESCFVYDECEMLLPFLDLGKPVFHAEYEPEIEEFCAESRRLGLSSIRKRLDLDPWRETC